MRYSRYYYAFGSQAGVGAISNLNPAKVTLFTMIFCTIRKAAFAIYGHFIFHCICTAVLRSILSYSIVKA